MKPGSRLIAKSRIDQSIFCIPFPSFTMDDRSPSGRVHECTAIVAQCDE
jgi:hypothetical protein